MSSAVVAVVSLVAVSVAVCESDTPAADFDKYSVRGSVGRSNVVELFRASCFLRHGSCVPVDWLGEVGLCCDEGSIHHRHTAG